MTELDKFRDTVEKYMVEHQMPPTTFGRKFASDPKFVFRLREGSEPRTSTQQKILSRISKQSQVAA